MKTGPEIQTELEKIGYENAQQFALSKTAPSISILSDSSKVVFLSTGYSVDEYLQKLWNGEKPSACIAWNVNGVIYYYALGYTDRGNKIPLNANSSYMFSRGEGKSAPAVTQFDLSGFDTSKVTNMSHMFYNVDKVKYLDLTGFDVKSLADTSSMFETAYALERIYVKSGTDWSSVASVTNSTKMFFNSPYLKSSPKGEQDVGISGKGIEYARIFGLNGIDKGYFTDENTKPALDKITVDASASGVKKSYFAGEPVDKTGLVVTAYYKDGEGNETSETVNAGYEAELDASNSLVKITFAKDGVTKTATYSVTINEGYIVTVKHLFENLADSNYSSMKEEKKGFASGASFTPTAMDYDSNIYSLETTLSPLTVNENKTVEVKYKRNICSFNFAARASDGYWLNQDSSYSAQIKGIPGVTNVSFAASSDLTTTPQKLTISAKVGTDLSKVTDAHYLKAKGYLRDTSKSLEGYSAASNQDSAGFPKTVKADMNNKNMIVYWRLPTIAMLDGNGICQVLTSSLGAAASSIKFIPAKSAPSNIPNNRIAQLSNDYFKGTSTKAEVLCLAWTDFVNGSPVIYYYADCGNASNVDGYPAIPLSDVANMFKDCKNLQEIDLSAFVIKGESSFKATFSGCTALKTVRFGSIDTSKVATMSEMFMGCENLASFDYSSFVKSSCTDLSKMFYNCKKLSSVDMSSWNTSKVQNMNSMFFACQSLASLDVCKFDVTSVTDMGLIFAYCANLTTIYAKSGTDWSGKTGNSPFTGCAKLKGGSGTTWTTSSSDSSISRAKIDGGTSSPGYFTAKN